MNMKWINIKDTKPKDGQRVLTWNTLYEEVRIQQYNSVYDVWDYEDGEDYEFELDLAPYWMPLPEKPEP